MSKEPVLSIDEQAFLLAGLVDRCKMRDGSFSDAIVTISAEDAKRLDALVLRLYRMAPYENKIRGIVTGR